MKHLLAAAKAARGRLFVDECQILRVAKGSFDDSTGKRVEVAHVVYEGPCRLKFAGVSQSDNGERNVVLTRPVLELPADDTSDIRERDVVAMTASENPNVVGRLLSILGADLATTASARRFSVEAKT